MHAIQGANMTMNQRHGHFAYNRIMGNFNVPKLFGKIYINIAVIDTK